MKALLVLPMVAEMLLLMSISTPPPALMLWLAAPKLLMLVSTSVLMLVCGPRAEVLQQQQRHRWGKFDLASVVGP